MIFVTETHFCRAMVNAAMQLVARHSDEAIACSCDNKAKLNVGVLACSRHYKHRRFFLTEDEPNYPGILFEDMGMRAFL